MKKAIVYIAMALFCTALILFSGYLVFTGMELTISPFLEVLGFIGFLAAFFALAYGIKKIMDFIKRKREENRRPQNIS